MQNNIFKIALLMLMSLIFSCGPRPTVSTIKNVEDLSTYSTYAYLPNTNLDISSPNTGNNGIVTQNVIKALNQGMHQKGYILDREKPDLLLVLNAHYNKETAKTMVPVYANPEKPDGVEPISAYYEPYYYWEYANFNDMLGFKIKEVADKRAGLVIEMISRKTEKVIWRGWAKAPLTQQKDDLKMTDYVGLVLEELPDNAKTKR